MLLLLLLMMMMMMCICHQLGSLKKLTQLDLFENKFDKLPDNIGDLSSLTDLLVSRNQLETLPQSIGIYLLIAAFGHNEPA